MALRFRLPFTSAQANIALYAYRHFPACNGTSDLYKQTSLDNHFKGIPGSGNSLLCSSSLDRCDLPFWNCRAASTFLFGGSAIGLLPGSATAVLLTAHRAYARTPPLFTPHPRQHPTAHTHLPLTRLPTAVGVAFVGAARRGACRKPLVQPAGRPTRHFPLSPPYLMPLLISRFSRRSFGSRYSLQDATADGYTRRLVLQGHS